jgi:hypothetical protein
MIKKIKILDTINTSILVGLIWTIQLVHYPSFNFIDPENYKNFQVFHMNAITPLVGPLMGLEMILFLLAINYKLYPKKLSMIVIFLLILSVWLTTALVSVPFHNTLLNGKDLDAISKLVTTNWIRTLAWTLKLILMSIWQIE